MTPTSTSGRALSIAAGILFTAGALGILLEDVALHNAPWTLKHYLTIVTVAGTLMVGHLGAVAWGGRHRLAFLGFAVLFTAGTGLTVYNSVGRQAEHTLIASAEVAEADKARLAAKDGLARAETMLEAERRDLAREVKKGGCGKVCQGINVSIATYESSIRGFKADLEKLGPPRVVVPEARRAGEIAAVFGYDATKVEAGAILVAPFLTTLLFEFGAIVSLGYGMRRQPVPMSCLGLLPACANPVTPPAMLVAEDDDEDLPALPKGGQRAYAKLDALRDLLDLTRNGADIPSQDWLKDRWQLGSKGTVSKWLTEWETAGLIARAPNGRCKAIEAA